MSKHADEASGELKASDELEADGVLEAREELEASAELATVDEIEARGAPMRAELEAGAERKAIEVLDCKGGGKGGGVWGKELPACNNCGGGPIPPKPVNLARRCTTYSALAPNAACQFGSSAILAM